MRQGRGTVRKNSTVNYRRAAAVSYVTQKHCIGDSVQHGPLPIWIYQGTRHSTTKVYYFCSPNMFSLFEGIPVMREARLAHSTPNIAGTETPAMHTNKLQRPTRYYNLEPLTRCDRPIEGSPGRAESPGRLSHHPPRLTGAVHRGSGWTENKQQSIM